MCRGRLGMGWDWDGKGVRGRGGGEGRTIVILKNNREINCVFHKDFIKTKTLTRVSKINAQFVGLPSPPTPFLVIPQHPLSVTLLTPLSGCVFVQLLRLILTPRNNKCVIHSSKFI